jgi:oligopeptide transport system ATP-binding protein
MSTSTTKSGFKHLLEVRNLTTRFDTEDGVVYAVNGISYNLDEGETIGVVGESGCGKSVHALSIMRLIPSPPGRIEAGEVLFQGIDLVRIPLNDMRSVRGSKIAMIFQDPMTSLNPVLTVGFQISETLKLHMNMTSKEARTRSAELLDLVGIPEARHRLDDYPHQFSGGMRQRAMIAMALSCNPSILIADEPTTALDVTIQAQIIELVKQLRDKFGMAIIWITHDLGIVAGLADKVNVMYAGSIIETGPVKQIYANPRHPYTVGLLGSLPAPKRVKDSKLYSIKGEPPDLVGLPAGCAFSTRCTFADDRCLVETPNLEEVEPGHLAACLKKETVRKMR